MSAQEMVLNPNTGEWEYSFTFIQEPGELTYVKLGKAQRKFIEKRVSTNLHTITQEALDRLHKILKNDKYSLSDRSWMNWQFHRKLTE